jgi:hypothetical protein
MAKTDLQSIKVRLYFLDWLRVLAFGLLVFYHAGLIFVDWGFHIRNNSVSDTLKPPLLFLNQWRLPLLFFVSGAGTFFALGKRTGSVFVKERFVRLFIPLVFGILIIIPPQVYYERLSQHAFEGSYLQFYPHFYKGLYPSGNFTWNHLWFIVYLFAFSLIAIPLFIYLRTFTGKKVIQKIETALSVRAALLLMALPLFVIESTLRHRWPDTRNLVSDWYNFSFYFVVFIYGYVLSGSRSIWQTIENDRRTYLLLGITSFLIIFFGWHAGGKNFLEHNHVGYVIFMIFKSVNSWCWILCLLGYSRKHLDINSQALQYANKAVYPFYILHQTVLIIIGYYIIQLDTGIATKYTLAVFGTYTLTLAIYELVVKRLGIMKVLFGVK